MLAAAITFEGGVLARCAGAGLLTTAAVLERGYPYIQPANLPIVPVQSSTVLLEPLRVTGLNIERAVDRVVDCLDQNLHVAAGTLALLAQILFRREALQVGFCRKAFGILLGREALQVVLGRKCWQNLLDDCDPVIDIFDPVIEIFDPVIETFDPVIETFDPVIETFDPVIETLDAVIEICDSLIEICDPTIEISEQRRGL